MAVIASRELGEPKIATAQKKNAASLRRFSRALEEERLALRLPAVASAATAAVAAAATTATAATRSLRLRFVDLDLAAVERSAVQLLDRGLRLSIARHLD